MKKTARKLTTTEKALHLLISKQVIELSERELRLTYTFEKAMADSVRAKTVEVL